MWLLPGLLVELPLFWMVLRVKKQQANTRRWPGLLLALGLGIGGSLVTGGSASVLALCLLLGLGLLFLRSLRKEQLGPRVLSFRLAVVLVPFAWGLFSSLPSQRPTDELVGFAFGARHGASRNAATSWVEQELVRREDASSAIEQRLADYEGSAPLSLRAIGLLRLHALVRGAPERRLPFCARVEPDDRPTDFEQYCAAPQQ